MRRTADDAQMLVRNTVLLSKVACDSKVAVGDKALCRRDDILAGKMLGGDTLQRRADKGRRNDDKDVVGGIYHLLNIAGDIEPRGAFELLDLVEDEIKRLGNLYTVRVTVRWGDRRRGNGEEESYVTFWRKSE